MKAAEKYRRVFGSISHLKDQIPWTTGLSNMVEFLVWEPQRVLGISKKQYVRQIIEWARLPELENKSIEEVEKVISKKLIQKMSESEQLETYSTQTTGICNAREAVRRVKFFSEDYLNKEFDIFLNLCSDSYLNLLYAQFINFDQSGSWSTHGNSGIFEYSTELNAMFMDNLSYNHEANVMVANELKLNGQKNADQILKYCLMYEYLLEIGFIDKGTKFLLLFIGGSALKEDKQSLVDKEIAMCQSKPEKYQHLLRDELLEVVAHLEIASITWQSLIEFNNCYLNEHEVCQVEQKLLQGFNQSIQSKSFMHL
ncbi:hypothetical protein [Psychrobacter sp. DAB_AL32B]|uniref:hypothetical protein n=1 Tax=Psychrobacter sp. DAB_AL32B TaxID=1028414 RepID=UPI000B7DFDB4|nr:hypothetical protein [Psychrobacter sp. DAB_AL32B]OXL23170.1 hypothetical protein CAN34_07750 [Psychrobacter sp. DAB_AL32B]